MTRIISQVSNNQEKAYTYQMQMGRLKLARDQGFYYEAIFILYAMMEDRLLAFLFHAGVIDSNSGKITKNNEVKSQLLQILDPVDQSMYRLGNISTKIKILSRILRWSTNFTVEDSNQDYQNNLGRQINRTAGKDEILLTLENVQEWCQVRNQLVHALMHKKLENQAEILHSLVEDGYAYCRKLDNFVRSFKVRNNIRKQFNIQ